MDARVKALEDALEWYAEKARSLATKKTANPEYSMAIFTELSLDGGQRAKKAMDVKSDE